MKELWRSVEERDWLREGRDVASLLSHYPQALPSWETLDDVSRRDFIALLGASMALSGLACAPMPEQKAIPFVRTEEPFDPSRSRYYATSLTEGGIARGALVRSFAGRPVKIEGNPGHPDSLGGSDARMQAELLSLYDPDRSRSVRERETPSTWDRFVAEIARRTPKWAATGGRGLRLLLEPFTSPALASQLGEFLGRYPEASWHVASPLFPEGALEGARALLGAPALPLYHFDRARVIVALDSDFLMQGAGHLRYAREFAATRRVRHDADPAQRSVPMSRLYVAEPSPTVTGAVADHRIPFKASEIVGLAHAIATATQGRSPSSDGRRIPWAEAVISDLRASRGQSIVIAGDGQPREVHELALAANAALGNLGKTVELVKSPWVLPKEATPRDSLARLLQDMRAGQVETLLILGSNPVFALPSAVRFGDALAKVPLKIHLGSHFNETAAACDWHIPEVHELETWGDARASTGLASLQQPLIAPLHSGRSRLEVLSALLGRPGADPRDIVRKAWASVAESDWHEAVRTGVIARTDFPPFELKTTPSRPLPILPQKNAQQAGVAQSVVELHLAMDPFLLDGRHANNAWLQELPRPLTRHTWENLLLLSPNTAAPLQIKTGDVIELSARGSSVQVPAYVLPGQMDDTVTLYLGYGRTRAGQVGNRVGADAFRFLPPEGESWVDGVRLRKTERHVELAVVQHHQTMEGRDQIHAGTLAEFRMNPKTIVRGEKPEHSFFGPRPMEGQQWGMSIDLSTCIGCAACVVACQSENNIPVVGRDQVRRGREMHWIRIDRYYEGNAVNPTTYFQPVPCMHCETAPCEEVCPTEATVHDREGLNQMTYNRCVGTRYCSNNCPYKVRRFNFLQYSDLKTPTLQLSHNPSVTVRSRGVMEKCTYCVQRIREAQIAAQRDSRALQDGEIRTACQSACPTDAIVFGNIADPRSLVARLKREPLDYGLLAELGTRPRTSYLAKLTNPRESEGSHG